MASTAAGFLVPVSAPVPYDDELLDLLQPIIVGISGYLDPSLVRPRWQAPAVPNQPDYASDWIGFGISRMRVDTFAFEGHVPTGLGHNVIERSEEHDVLVSCYGPKAQSFAAILYDGFAIEQNRAYLNAIGMDTLYVSEPVNLPALLHGAWVKRVDLTVTLRRYISRAYEVRTITDLPAPGVQVTTLGLDNEHYITPINPLGS